MAAQINLSALSDVTQAVKSISNAILVTPLKDQGITPMAITGETIQQAGTNDFSPILFDYEGEQSVDIESDITDHYTEDNQALQDQIALRPIIIRTQGFVAELADIVPPSLQPLQTIAAKLTPLVAYTPELTLTALLAYNAAVTAYAVGKLGVSAAVSKWGSVDQQTKQQAMYLRFMGYWNQRRLFKVQTPWYIAPFCAIQNVRAVQDPSTRTISTFEVTFKTIRFAQTNVGAFVDPGMGRYNNYAAPLLDNGSSTPAPGPQLLDQFDTSGLV